MSNKLPNIGSDVSSHWNCLHRFISYTFLCWFFCCCSNRPCCKGYHKPHKLLSLCVPFFNYGGNKKKSHHTIKIPGGRRRHNTQHTTKNVIIFLLHNLPYNVLTRIPNTKTTTKKVSHFMNLRHTTLCCRHRTLSLSLPPFSLLFFWTILGISVNRKFIDIHF